MSMGKDRKRSVKWSNCVPHRPPAYIDTGARGGYYDITHIYIPPYTVRQPYFIPWVLDLTNLPSSK